MKIRLSYFRLPLILLAVVAVFYFQFQNQLVAGILRRAGFTVWSQLATEHFLALDKEAKRVFDQDPFAPVDSSVSKFLNPKPEVEAFAGWLKAEAPAQPLIKAAFIWRRGVDSLQIIPVKTAPDFQTRQALLEYVDAIFKPVAAYAEEDSLWTIANRKTGFSLYHTDYPEKVMNSQQQREFVKVAFGIIWDEDYYHHVTLPAITANLPQKLNLADQKVSYRPTGIFSGILLADAAGDTAFSYGRVQYRSGLWIDEIDNIYAPWPSRFKRLPGWHLYVQDETLTGAPLFSVEPPRERSDIFTAFFTLYRNRIMTPMRQQYLYLSLLMAGILAIITAEVYARKRQRELIARVSHELRTPVAKVRLFAETLRRERIMSAEQEQEYLDTILRESDHLAVLVDNSLNYARLDADRMKVKPIPVAASEFLMPFFEAQRLYLEQSGFRYEISIPGNLPAVRVDREAMELALRNILDNAVKYSNLQKEISVSAEMTSGRLKIAIADRGPGVPGQDCRKIFRPYYRLNRRDAENIGGAGLGLSLVQRIVKEHGGKVRCEPRPGGGSVFVVELPA